MKYKILVIDDDEPIHFMAKGLLGSEFELSHAKNAQEAINILSSVKINLILSDIHMPGLTGLELLESLRKDPEKKRVPVIVMTNLPTVEKEQKALDLGAADFIKKELFTKDQERILDIVRMKLVTNVQVPGLQEDLVSGKESLVMELMQSALIGDFNETIEVLVSELNALTDAGFTAFWRVDGDKSSLVYSFGDKKPGAEELSNLDSESTMNYLRQNRAPYMVNHISSSEIGFFAEFSKTNNLSSEITIPMYSVSEKGLITNNMEVPEDADLFGLISIKRSVLFSDTEFQLISKLITQAGSIIWRLYNKSR